MSRETVPQELCLAISAWRRIDEVCIRFESAWRAGEPPSCVLTSPAFRGRTGRTCSSTS
jgi:hypothetical protein